jgi:hypothetical protein
VATVPCVRKAAPGRGIVPETQKRTDGDVRRDPAWGIGRHWIGIANGGLRRRASLPGSGKGDGLPASLTGRSGHISGLHWSRAPDLRRARRGLTRRTRHRLARVAMLCLATVQRTAGQADPVPIAADQGCELLGRGLRAAHRLGCDRGGHGEAGPTCTKGARAQPEDCRPAEKRGEQGEPLLRAHRRAPRLRCTLVPGRTPASITVRCHPSTGRRLSPTSMVRPSPRLPTAPSGANTMEGDIRAPPGNEGLAGSVTPRVPRRRRRGVACPPRASCASSPPRRLSPPEPGPFDRLPRAQRRRRSRRRPVRRIA